MRAVDRILPADRARATSFLRQAQERLDQLPLVTSVVVRYGATVAVREVDVSVARGEVVAVMGRNGCGKSSLLWALQGTGRRDGADGTGMVKVQRNAHGASGLGNNGKVRAQYHRREQLSKSRCREGAMQ